MNSRCLYQISLLKVMFVVLFIISVSALDSRPVSAYCAPIPNGLVSWWRAENNANDAAGHNNGILQNGVTFTKGEVGQGFSFNHRDAFVKLPDNLFPFPMTGISRAAFSFELWFKTNTGGVILGQQDSRPFTPPRNYVPAIYVGTDGKLYVETFWWAVAAPMVSVSRVNDGIFHHLGVLYGAGIESVYLDGSLLGSIAFGQVAYSPSGYKYQLGTGYSADWPAAINGWYDFQGVIDEISLYNRALTPAEIRTIYQAGVEGKCLSPVHIRGRVTDSKGVPMVGVIVTCAGGSAVTNSYGEYILSGIFPGTYNVIPHVTGYDFEPDSSTVLVRMSDVDNIDFVAFKASLIGGHT